MIIILACDNNSGVVEFLLLLCVLQLYNIIIMEAHRGHPFAIDNFDKFCILTGFPFYYSTKKSILYILISVNMVGNTSIRVAFHW